MSEQPSGEQEDPSVLVAARRAKLERLRTELGVEPFGQPQGQRGLAGGGRSGQKPAVSPEPGPGHRFSRADVGGRAC